MREDIKSNNYSAKFDHMWTFLPEDIGSILDVGGGAGYLYESYKQERNKEINYLLIDKNDQCLQSARERRINARNIFVYGPNFASLSSNGSRRASSSQYLSHIYFITYRNIIYWSKKLGLKVLKSRAFWYKRYYFFRWFLEPFFKNLGAVHEILLYKEGGAINEPSDINFKFWAL